MIIKTKDIEVYEIHFDDQLWFLSHEKETESTEEFYILEDSNGDEVINNEIYNEIIEYFESEIIEGPLTFEDLYDDEDHDYD